MRQRPFWHYVVPGSISGGFLSMGIWIIGMKLITSVSVGAVLNQLAVVFIIVFAALFLREKITIKKAFSLILAVIGGLIVIL
jgi:drug/metabolite transporter (DMT)-like permease